MYKWHAEEAWLASLIIQAKINANDQSLAKAEIAEAESIVEGVFQLASVRP